MRIIDILYLVIVSFTFIMGLLFALRIFIKIRNKSIEEFKKRQQKNRNKIKYGRHN